MKAKSKELLAKKEMIREIQEELIIYFRQGIINITNFFELEDVKFQNVYDILKIHFILSNDVRDYVLSLEKNMRTIKTSTLLEKKLYRGEVRGQIDWHKTIQHRHRYHNMDKTSFVTDNVDKLFETKENIILKRAVNIIYTIFHQDLDLSNIKKYDWYGEGDKIAKIVANVYKSNIYIKKMQTAKIKISDKMIADVLKSRNKIYRDSARIVRLYRELMALDKEHMKSLFTETFIEMHDINEVFELYCIFNYLKGRFNKEIVTYHMINGHEKYLASVDDDEFHYKIYHDRAAVDYLNFQIHKSEIEGTENDYLNRKLTIIDRKNKIMRVLGKKSSSTVWVGRPDLIIIKLNKKDETIMEIEIGEIKYTKNLDYLFTGLEELLEYMHLVKDKNDYIHQDKIKGILFVDDVELDVSTFGDIEIITKERLTSIGKQL